MGQAIRAGSVAGMLLGVLAVGYWRPLGMWQSILALLVAGVLLGVFSLGHWRPLWKAVLTGLVAGMLLGVLAGGYTSAVYGRPFVGTKGDEAFWSGLIFPGLIALAPLGAVAGSALGGVVAAAAGVRRRYHRDPPAPGRPE